MIDQLKWEEFEWDIEKGDSIHHKQLRDLRKRIWLATTGHFSTIEKAEFKPQVIGSTDIRYAKRWEDIMTPHPDSDIVLDNAGAFPTECNAWHFFPQYSPGSFTCFFEYGFTHNIVGAVLTGSDYEFKFAATTVKQYSIGDQTGCTIAVKNGSADADIDQAILDGDALEFFREKDNLRPGTPILVTNTTSNNGLYRVKSVRDDGSNVFIKVDNNKYEQQDLVVEGAGGTATCNPNHDSNGKNGDWGGDWYTLRSGNGSSGAAYDGSTNNGKMNTAFEQLGDEVYNSSLDLWWNTHDLHHTFLPTSTYPYPTDKEELLEYLYVASMGIGDHRPPAGGQYSKDFNEDWCRVPNPSLFATYDENCHRATIQSDSDGSQGDGYQQWAAVFPAESYLNKQVDPKEQITPWRFIDSGSTRWKYGTENGNKVKSEKSQITNVDKLGAIASVRRTGYITTGGTPVPSSTAKQYQSTYSVDPGAANTGNRTAVGSNPNTALDNYRDNMINEKYDDALQVMVEHACELKKWVAGTDDTYKENWADLYSDTVIKLLPRTFDHWVNVTTYSTGDYVQHLLVVYKSRQNNNYYHTPTVSDTTWWEVQTVEDLRNHNSDIDFIWKPEVNSNQPVFALLNDELFGENGSAYEKILKDLGSEYYDWYLDVDRPYRSARVLDASWLWYYSLDSAGKAAQAAIVGSSDPDTIMDYYWKEPIGTWRRCAKYSLGRVSNTRMRSGNLADPVFHTYADYSTHPVTSQPIKGYGHFRMTAEDTSDFSTWDDAITKVNSTFVLAGDRTTEVSSGDLLVDYSVSSPYPTYKVLRLVYDSSENETTFYMDDNFTSASPTPTHIYGNSSISERHDPGYILIDPDDGTTTIDVYNKNVYKIMNQCRTVLEQLEYMSVDLLIGLNYLRYRSSFDTTGVVHYGDTAFDVSEQWVPLCKDWYNTQPLDEFVGEQDDYSQSRVGGYALTQYDSGTETWSAGDFWTMHRGSIILSLAEIDVLSAGSGEEREFNVYLEGHCYDQHYDWSTGVLLDGSSTPLLKGQGLDIASLSNYPDRYYGMATLSKSSLTKYDLDDKLYKVYYPLEDGYDEHIKDFNENPIPTDTAGDGQSVAIYKIPVEPLIVCKFNWDKFGDKIFERTLERVLPRLEDWNEGGDENAPQ